MRFPFFLHVIVTLHTIKSESYKYNYSDLSNKSKGAKKCITIFWFKQIFSTVGGENNIHFRKWFLTMRKSRRLGNTWNNQKYKKVISRRLQNLPKEEWPHTLLLNRLM